MTRPQKAKGKSAVAKQAPTKVAKPPPPRKRSQMGQLWPAIAKAGVRNRIRGKDESPPQQHC